MDTRTLVIAFPTFEAARQAIERLENAGLEGASMAFDEDDRQAADRSGASVEQDSRMVRRMTRNLTGAVVLGVLLGALLGAGAGLLMFPDGPVAGIVAMAIGVAAAGAGVAIAVGGIARHKQSEAWADTFEAPERSATLRVTISTQEEQDLVVAAARDAGGELDGG